MNITKSKLITKSLMILIILLMIILMIYRINCNNDKKILFIEKL